MDLIWIIYLFISMNFIILNQKSFKRSYSYVPHFLYVAIIMDPISVCKRRKSEVGSCKHNINYSVNVPNILDTDWLLLASVVQPRRQVMRVSTDCLMFASAVQPRHTVVAMLWLSVMFGKCTIILFTRFRSVI